MKLRQKLAMVLATAMVVTAVPVVTFADTTNKINTNLNIQTGQTVDTFVTFTVSDHFDTTENGESIAYIDITNAEFLVEGYGTDWEPITVTTGSGIAVKAGSVRRISKTELQVKLTGNFKKEDQIRVPLNFKAGEGEIKVTVKGEDGLVSTSTHVLTEKASKYSASVSVGTAKNISERGGQIADVIITESNINAFDNNLLGRAETSTVKVSLPTNSDLEFAADSRQEVKVTGKKAYAGIVKADGKPYGVTTEVIEGGQSILIKLDATTREAFKRNGVNSVGSLVFSGIKVVPQDRKDIKTGTVEVEVYSADVKGKELAKEDRVFETTKDLKVAEVADYGVNLTTVKEVEVIAGKEAVEVSFNLTETIEGSLHKNKLVEFSLDNGFFGIVNPEAQDAEAQAIKLLGDILKKDTKGEKITTAEFYDVEIQKDGRVTGFTLDVSKLQGEKANDLFFTMEVQAPVAFTGDITLKVQDGGVDHKDLTTKLATVKAPYEVKAEAMTAKVGLTGQKGGKITITETAGQMLDKGQIVLELKDNKGIKFANKDFKIEAKNLKVEVEKVEDGVITLDVVRTSSKEAGSIVISDIVFDVDRTVAEGNFDLAISGDALSEVVTYAKEDKTMTLSKDDAIVVEDFMIVGTPNTEDILNGMKKGTASFTIGATKYTVNGEEKEMDATPYVTAKNRTMMPLRYVSEAFGIEGNNVIFTKANGTITILAGTRTLQLTNGSDIATLNGAAIKMDEKVTIKNGRTYVPVGEIGRLLGVSVNWDDATKTATFTNK